MQIRTTIFCLLAIMALTGCHKAPVVSNTGGDAISFEDAGAAVTSSWPTQESFIIEPFAGSGIVRSEAEATATGINVRAPFDWSRRNVLFIREFDPLHTIIFSEFRIVAITRHPDRLVVRTSIVRFPKIGLGGATRELHAVFIPATDLPVVFERLPSPGTSRRPMSK